MRYDGQGCVRAHIMNLIDTRTKLQDLGMNVDEDMMVHFALNSLPKEFKPLKDTYIAQKETSLITICVQQEHNISRERGAKMVNLVQSKQNKEYRNKGIAYGKEKEKENDSSSPKASKQVGLKCFFCKKTGYTKRNA